MSEKNMEHHKDIREAQEYLTRIKDGEKELIVGIDYLSENHSRQEIVRFLKDYLHEKEKMLKALILSDKTSLTIDQTVAVMFRLHMAISIIEKRMEVNHIVRFKQGARKSVPFRKRNRSSHRRSRKWQNKNHDGKNWETGHHVRCVA